MKYTVTLVLLFLSTWAYAQNIECTEEEQVYRGGDPTTLPVIVKICKKGAYIFKRVDTPNAIEEYTYEYTITKNGEEITNKDLFNSRLPELEGILHERLMPIIDAYLQYEESKDCMTPPRDKHGVDDYGIYIDDTGAMYFHTIFLPHGEECGVAEEFIKLEAEEIQFFLAD
jgi:hypothetical protein